MPRKCGQSKGQAAGPLFTAFWCLLLFTGLCHAERLPIKNLTIENGLATNTIHKIVPDSHGFFWICTASGLARFDGYGFTNFSVAQGLPGERVWDILETTSGDFWVATSGGLVKFTPDGTVYDRVVRKEEAATLERPPLFVTYEPPAESKNVTRLAFETDGRIWVGTANGLFKFDNGEFAAVSLPFANAGSRYVHAMMPGRDGSLWVGSYGVLFRIHGEGIKALSRDATAFQCFIEDSKGRVWVGTSQIGVVELAVAADGTPTFARTFPELVHAGNWVNWITESSDGTMWLATDDGLVEFNPSRDAPSFNIYTRKSGLGHVKFQSMVEDRAGNLWLGTRASGIFRIVRRGMVSFGAEDDLEFVRAVVSCENGQLCFVGFRASTALDELGAKAPLEAGRLYYPYIWQLGKKKANGFEWLRPNFGRRVEYFGWSDRQSILQTRNGEWWIGTGEGLFRFPAVKFGELSTVRPIEIFDAALGLSPSDVFRILEDSRGDIWIATNGAVPKEGLFRWERATGILHNVNPLMRETVPVKSNFVSAIDEDLEGNIWFGFFDSGIARFRNGRFEYFDETSGFPRGGGNDILVDAGGAIWVASGREGVVRITARGGDMPAFSLFNVRSGLSSNRTFALTSDLRNMIYVGTDRDVNRIDPISGKIVQVPFGSGLPQQQIRSAFTDGEGTLWFGTTSGLMKYVPLPDPIPESLDVLLTSVTIEGVAKAISALGEGNVSLGDLASDSNQVELKFTSLSAVINDRPRYQYRLSSSEEWSEPIDVPTISLAGLSAGSHSIEIRAVDAVGTVSRSPAVASFRILPPFYQRWWFLLLAVALVGGVIYLLYKHRVRRLLELEKVRTRIATDLHDDIGANLTRISVLSEVAKQNSNNGAGALLESIADIARESVASMGDIVWAIAPEHDSLLDLTRVMRRHAEEIFASRDVDLWFQVPQTELKLSVGARRDLLLIYKEAVNNVARHSACTQVAVDLTIERSVLRLRIADDGIGFKPDDQFTGHGLVSMANRARQLGGNLTIESNGLTVVQLEVGLEKSFI